MKVRLLKLEELDDIKSRGGIKENSTSITYSIKNREFLKLKNDINRLEKNSLKLSIKKIKS